MNSTDDEPEKFDHSGHPTDRPQPDDLKAPASGKGNHTETDDSRVGVNQKEPVTPPDSNDHSAA